MEVASVELSLAWNRKIGNDSDEVEGQKDLEKLAMKRDVDTETTEGKQPATKK